MMKKAKRVRLLQPTLILCQLLNEDARIIACILGLMVLKKHFIAFESSENLDFTGCM